MFSRGSFQGPELWLDPTLSFVIMQTISSPEVKGSQIHSVVCLLTQKMLLGVSSSDPASGDRREGGREDFIFCCSLLMKRWEWDLGDSSWHLDLLQSSAGEPIPRVLTPYSRLHRHMHSLHTYTYSHNLKYELLLEGSPLGTAHQSHVLQPNETPLSSDKCFKSE